MCKSAFLNGLGQFQPTFQVEGDHSQQLLWGQKTTEVSPSCDINILTNDYFLLSQYKRLTDEQTDGQTEFP